MNGSEIGAVNQTVNPGGVTQDTIINLYIGVFFDNTSSLKRSESDEKMRDKKTNKVNNKSNNPYAYSNVSILESIYKCGDSGNNNKHFSLYFECGEQQCAGERSKDAFFAVKQTIIEPNRPNADAGNRTANLYFDICGFGHGAACARMFCRLLMEKEPEIGFNKNDYKLGEKEIRNLLIIDTIVNCKDKIDDGLKKEIEAKKIVHICAMDEVRPYYSLVDIESSIGNGVEVFIPGCHSDVGGGTFIGPEGPKLFNEDTKVYVPSYYVHHKALFEEKDCLMKYDLGTMGTLGWLQWDDSKSVWSQKTTSKGYSNVVLNFLKKKANGEPFNGVPRSYLVPKDLRPLEKELTVIDSNGRYFVYPRCMEHYSELRHTYLHCTYNDQAFEEISDNQGNELKHIWFDKNYRNRISVLSRAVFSETSTVSNKGYMFDYGSKTVAIKKFTFGYYYDGKFLEEWRKQHQKDPKAEIKQTYENDKQKHDSGELRRNMVKVTGINPDNAAAHHLIGQQDDLEIRKILDYCGIGVNDPANGVFLPTTAYSTVVGQIHNGCHCKNYHNIVSKRFARVKYMMKKYKESGLESLESKEEIRQKIKQMSIEVLDSIRKDLIDPNNNRLRLY